MKSLRVCTVILTLALSAKATATPTLRLVPPPPGRLYFEHLWRVEINNPDDTTYRVYLHGEVREATQGVVFRANSQEFDLPKGRKTVRSQDITAVRDAWYAAGYKPFYTRTGGLPEGEYEYSVTLMPLGVGDSGEVKVRLPGPPELISPPDGDTVAEPYPLFVWTPPMPPPGGEITYDLTVVEAMPSQTAEEAWKANQPWFESKGIRTTSLRYPASGRRLEPGRAYCWWVSAKVAAGVVLEPDAPNRFCVAAAAARTRLTREQVIAIILGQVIKPDSLKEDLLAFLGREALKPGDKVRQAFDSTETEITRPTWFAWLDDDFTAEFGHPMRYVFVDASTGEVTVQNAEFWPVVNGEPIWQTREELAGDRFVFFERPERQ